MHTCVTTCPNYYYAITIPDRICASCYSNCYTCSGTSETNCLTCAIGNFLRANYTCGPTCDLHFYGKTTVPYICTACDISCLTCTGTTNITCLSCDTPLFFNSSALTCISSCLSTQFGQITPTRTCVNCTSPCLTCSAGGTNGCTSCASPNFLQTDFSCVTACLSS